MDLFIHIGKKLGCYNHKGNHESVKDFYAFFHIFLHFFVSFQIWLMPGKFREWCLDSGHQNGGQFINPVTNLVFTFAFYWFSVIFYHGWLNHCWEQNKEWKIIFAVISQHFNQPWKKLDKKCKQVFVIWHLVNWYIWQPKSDII